MISQLTAVSTGRLLSVTWKDEARTRRTFVYKTNVAVAPCNIAVAVAPFEVNMDDALDFVSHYWMPPAPLSPLLATSVATAVPTRGLLTHTVMCIPQILRVCHT